MYLFTSEGQKQNLKSTLGIASINTASKYCSVLLQELLLSDSQYLNSQGISHNRLSLNLDYSSDLVESPAGGEVSSSPSADFILS